MRVIETPKTGDVARYSFLWSDQYERGEETGRKARPLCLVIPLRSAAGTLAVFSSYDATATTVPNIHRGSRDGKAPPETAGQSPLLDIAGRTQSGHSQRLGQF